MQVSCAVLMLTTVSGLALATFYAPRDPGVPLPVVDADYYDASDAPEAKVELGRQLFFDKILSGNLNISCATCHHPSLASADGVALSFGEGASGLGPRRRAGRSLEDGVHERIPRNSPALFNVGAREFAVLFHDGRVEVDRTGGYDSGFISPAKWKLPQGLDNALAAQAMFPVISHIEMAGQQGENEIADAVAANNASGPGGAWELLADRLRQIPEYVRLFEAAFPGRVRGPQDITFVQAANAIAAFEAEAFRADDSPFDRHLRGETALAPDARRGMDLFYGKASCVSCHAGKFQTDHGFHAIAMPQIGPGKSDGWDGAFWRETGVRAFPEDFGRGRVTVRPEDNYKFRTPSLRNVALTGPWGHSGAYGTLEEVVRHHLDAERALDRYVLPPDLLPPLDAALETTASGSLLSHGWMSDRRFEAFLIQDTWVQRNARLRGQIASANRLPPAELTDAEVADLVAFLESLTDPASRDLAHLVPDRVPSGLEVER